MTLICPKCNLQMRRKQTGIGVESMADFGSYKLFAGDVWFCPATCGIEIVLIGTGQKPIAEHLQTNYEKQVASWKPEIRYWANQEEKWRWQEAHPIEVPF